MSDDYMHKEYPKRFDRTSFWEQIKRTVNGKPVSEQDINMIVDQIKRSLKPRSSDNLLDLGCGNAALASYIFECVDGYYGVDFSEYLIGVAREFFGNQRSTHYYCDDIVSFSNSFLNPEVIDKVLIYGVISYLPKQEVEQLITTISERFCSCQRVFIGNVPSREYADAFFKRRAVEDYQLDDPKSAIGVWWTPEEFEEIGGCRGFDVEILTMPESFYGAGYRFDVLMTRSARGCD